MNLTMQSMQWTASRFLHTHQTTCASNFHTWLQFITQKVAEKRTFTLFFVMPLWPWIFYRFCKKDLCRTCAHIATMTSVYVSTSGSDVFMAAQLEVMCLCQHSWKCCVNVSTTGSAAFMSAWLKVWCLRQNNWKWGVCVSTTGSVVLCQHDWKCAECGLCVNYYLYVRGDNHYLCVWGDNFTCVYGVTTITCVYWLTAITCVYGVTAITCVYGVTAITCVYGVSTSHQGTPCGGADRRDIVIVKEHSAVG